MVEVMTALWLVLMLFDAKYKPRKSWVLAMLAILSGSWLCPQYSEKIFTEASGPTMKEWKDWSLISTCSLISLFWRGL